MKLINVIEEILNEGLNLPKQQTAISFDDKYAYYATSKYGNAFNISGTMEKYHSGRSEEFNFVPDEMDNETEIIWDEHWEDISKEIENEYWKHLSKNKTKLSEEKKVNIKTTIKNLKKLSSEYKDVALSLIQNRTRAKNGIITGLKLHSDLRRKIRDKKYPSGFDMGIDYNGYFIHTHRARSKSHEKPDQITSKEIKFVDSTG